MPDGDTSLFTITDLKQFIYCPRILYYHTCLPDIRPVTVKMRAGIIRHEDEHKRSSRRVTRIEGAEQGERTYAVSLQSPRLNLTGEIDEVIWLGNEAVPVDYKLARHAGYHFKVQLAAYALMLEDAYSVKVRQGFLYLIQSRKVEAVQVMPKLRRTVTEALGYMKRITETEAVPEPTEWRQRCIECEFHRFCNDV